MERLRKLGNWVWLNKERMVLALMIIVLGWRVHQVVFPPPAETIALPGIPSPEVKEPPPDPPELPARLPPADWSVLVKQNPFWVNPGGSSTNPNRDDVAIDVVLLNIQKLSSGKYRARLQTGPRMRRWYVEGEVFETYRLEKINAESNSVEIYSEKHGKIVTLRMAGAAASGARG